MKLAYETDLTESEIAQRFARRTYDRRRWWIGLLVLLPPLLTAGLLSLGGVAWGAVISSLLLLLIVGWFIAKALTVPRPKPDPGPHSCEIHLGERTIAWIGEKGRNFWSWKIIKPLEEQQQHLILAAESPTIKNCWAIPKTAFADDNEMRRFSTMIQQRHGGGADIPPIDELSGANFEHELPDNIFSLPPEAKVRLFWSRSGAHDKKGRKSLNVSWSFISTFLLLTFLVLLCFLFADRDGGNLFSREVATAFVNMVLCLLLYAVLFKAVEYFNPARNQAPAELALFPQGYLWRTPDVLAINYWSEVRSIEVKQQILSITHVNDVQTRILVEGFDNEEHQQAFLDLAQRYHAPYMPQPEYEESDPNPYAPPKN